MEGEQTGQPDIIAELAKELNIPEQSADGKAQGASASDDLGDDFAPQPTDDPRIAARLKEINGKWREKSSRFAEQQRKVAEREAELDRAKRDLEDRREPDPRNGANGGGVASYAEVIKKHEGTFEPQTFNAILELANAIVEKKAYESGLLSTVGQLWNDRGETQWNGAVSQYGPGANAYREAAQKLMQKYPGMSPTEAVMLASNGEVRLNQIRQKVADARKRETVAPSVPEATATKSGIDLRREQRNRKIQEMAAQYGVEKYSRL